MRWPELRRRNRDLIPSELRSLGLAREFSTLPLVESETNGMKSRSENDRPPGFAPKTRAEDLAILRPVDAANPARRLPPVVRHGSSVESDES